MLSQVLDFQLNWVNLLLAITLYSGSTKTLTALILVPVIALSLASKPKPLKTQPINLVSHRDYLPFKPYLTVYRSQMMVITCLAILAVDFPIFPRRFAKVETWGTSMMDLGVGSSVFAMGLASARRLLVAEFEGRERKKYSILIGKSLSSAFPILAIGLLRLFFVKLLNYQEHETEYGTHWNFFITLGTLPVLLALLDPLFSLLPRFVVALLLTSGYEVLLVKSGLLSYILTAPRVDIISDNKEGIFSSLGYLAIFVFAQSCGFFVLPAFQSPNNLFSLSSKSQILSHMKTPKTWSVSPLKGLVLASLFFHTSYYILDTCYIYGVSRRLANILYVFWVCAYNTTLLAGFVLAESFFGSTSTSQSGKIETSSVYREKVPMGLDALNKNSLVIFLLANVTTGLVNMGVNTLDCSLPTSMLILIGYSGFLSMTSILMSRLDVVIR